MTSRRCPFCGPAPGIFAKSRNFRALYNRAPILPGHSLVVPKRHVESLMALSEAGTAEFLVFGREVARLLASVFRTAAFDLTIQEGVDAGQTVTHLHMHVIPRVAGDLPSPGDWYPRLRRGESEAVDSTSRPRLTYGELAAVVRRIKRSTRARPRKARRRPARPRRTRRKR
jgi:bis(5'-adenosyl)-triphosphatase